MTEAEIIQRHDHALAAYLTAVNEKAPAYITRQRAPYMDILNAGKNYYGYMSYVLDQMDATSGPHSPMVLYVQAAEALDGMLACLWNGCATSAFSVLRALFETEITLALMTERDVEVRARLYSEYEHVGRWQNLHNMQELVAEGLLSRTDFDAKYPPDIIREINDGYDRVKANYNPNRPNHWAWDILRRPSNNATWNPSLKSVCSHLRRLYDYNMLYTPLSMVAHASSRSRVALSTPDGQITLGPNYSERTAEFVMMGLGFAHKALDHMVAYLPTPKHDEQILYSLHKIHRAIQIMARGAA
jgi:hypothetical protein